MYKIEVELKKEQDIFDLYERLDWNAYVQKNTKDLVDVIKGSFYVIYLYDKQRLIATGRIISDGHLTALICGVGVDPVYQSKGIGRQIINHLVEYSSKLGIKAELTCEERLKTYYEALGFKQYGLAMQIGS